MRRYNTYFSNRFIVVSINSIAPNPKVPILNNNHPVAIVITSCFYLIYNIIVTTKSNHIR